MDTGLCYQGFIFGSAFAAKSRVVRGHGPQERIFEGDEMLGFLAYVLDNASIN